MTVHNQVTKALENYPRTIPSVFHKFHVDGTLLKRVKLVRGYAETGAKGQVRVKHRERFIIL